MTTYSLLGRAFVAATLLSALTFYPCEAAAQTAPAPPATFRVGDAVRIAVWNNEQFNGELNIADDGTIIHPLYRSINLAGLTIPQAEAEFVRVLRRFVTEPEIVVEALFRIPVSGQVNAPNIYSVSSNATLAQVLVQAGGPTPAADLRRVRLLRDGREILLDLRNPDDDFARMRIRSGDQILVDPRRSLWRDSIEPSIRTVGSLASIAYLIIRINSGSTR